METKQTAINFLIEQIIDKQPAGFYVIDSQEECYKLFELARQMEKEQIAKAWDDGDYAYFYSKETGKDFENGEQYYNKIYGN